MVAQYVVAAPKVENINFGWFSSGKLVAPKEDNIHPVKISECGHTRIACRFVRSPIHGAKNGGRAFPYAPSVSLAFLIPSAAPSMMISSFSSIPFSIRSMCFRRSLSPPSLSG